MGPTNTTSIPSSLRTPKMVSYSITEDDVKDYVKNITSTQVEELRRNVKGRVLERFESQFTVQTRIFNGGIQSPACLLVTPVDTDDVQQVVLFCVKHSLTPSVKSGGYGTHGLSVEGDIIIDMSNMTDVEISPDYVTLRRASSVDPDVMNTDPQPQAPYPMSILAVGEPPDIVPSRRRKAEEAFSDEEDRERTPPAVASAPQPMTGADVEINRPRESLPTSRLPAKSSSSEKEEQDSRRIRPRRTSPDVFPSRLDMVLNASVQRSAQAAFTDNQSASAERSLYIPAPLSSRDSGQDSNSRSGSLSASLSGSMGDSSIRSRSTRTPPTSAGEEDSGGRMQSVSSEATRSISSSVAAPSPPFTVSPPSDDTDTRLELNRQPSFPFPNTDRPQPSSPLPPPPALSAGPFSYAAPQPDLPSVSPPLNSSGPFSYHYQAQPTMHSASTSTPVPPQGFSNAPSPAHTVHPIVPEHQYAYVTFGAGASQKNVDAFTGSHPLKGISATGQAVDVPYYVPFAAHPVGSTVMMLGGFGFLSRLHGLSLDNLVEVEMVLADGSIVVVNEADNKDLFWAVRGAGSAFGIATRYKAKAYPVPIVYAGNIVYEFHRSTAASLMKHFRDCIKAAPRELYANLILTAGPRSSGALVVIQLCYIGTREKGAEYLNAMLSWDGGSCLLSEVHEKSFLNQQDSVAKVLKAAAGRKWFIRSDVVKSLTDEAIHETVIKFANTPDGCAWLFELGGGAIADFEDTCIPKVMREGSFNIVAFHQWKIEEVDDRCVSSAEDWMAETIARHSAGGPLPCFFERCERVTRTIASFGEDNWELLCELKRTYDPRGMIRHNFWPLDEDGRPLGLKSDMAHAKGKTMVDGVVDDGDDGYCSPSEEESRLHDKKLDAVSSNESFKTKKDKGKGREDLRLGNHFMDRSLRP